MSDTALGPGRWRFRHQRGQERFRARRADGTRYTRPTIVARVLKRRARTRPRQQQHKFTKEER